MQLSEKLKCFWIFLIFSIGFNFDKLLLGPHALVRLHDSFNSELIRYLAISRHLSEGFFSWLPDLAGGSPVNAFHFGPEYLLVLASSIFPPWFIYHFVAILLMFLAGFGMTVLLKNFFKLSFEISVFGGLLFAFISQFQANSLIHTVFNLTFPFIFVLLHSAYGKSSGIFLFKVSGLIFISCLSYPVLTGPMFPALHLALIVILGMENKRILWVWGKQFVLFWMGYALLFTPNLIALLKFVPLGQRNSRFSESNRGDFLTSLSDFFSVLWKGIFIDIFSITLLFPFVLAGIILSSKNKKLGRMGILLLVLMVISAIFTSKLSGYFSETFLARMDLGHFIWTIPPVTVLFAMLTLDEFNRSRQKIRQQVLLLGGLGAFLPLLQNPVNFKLLGLNLLMIVGIGYYIVIKQGRDFPILKLFSRSFHYLVLGAMVFVMFLGGKVLRMVEGERVVYSSYFQSHPALKSIEEKNRGDIFRVATVGLPPALAQSYGFETLGARSPLLNGYFKDYFEQIVDPQLDSQEKKDSFRNYPYDLLLQIGYQSHPEHKFMRRPKAEDWNWPLLYAGNVRYIISNRQILGMKGKAVSVQKEEGDKYVEFGGLGSFLDRQLSKLSLFNSGNIGRRRRPIPLYIYELGEWLPRAWLTKNVEVFDDREKVLDTLRKADTQTLSEVAYIFDEDVDLAGLDQLRGKKGRGKAENLKIIDYSADRIVLSTNVKEARLAIISNNYDPHWSVTVNGEEAKIFRVNHAFQGIILPKPGAYEIELKYEDGSKKYLLISMPVGFLLISFSVFPLRKNRAMRVDHASAG